MKTEIFKGKAFELSELIASWQSECNIEKFNFEPNIFSCLNDIQNIIDHNDAVLTVLTACDSIVGVLGFYVNNIGISESVVAYEHYWYVLPKYRRLGAIRLFKYAQTLAKSLGCTHILMHASMMASDKHDTVCRLYEKMSMIKFETTYIKEL